MKLLASLLLALTLAATDDPPPFECPLCGGNAKAHEALVAKVTWGNGLVLTRAMTALFLG